MLHTRALLPAAAIAAALMVLGAVFWAGPGARAAAPRWSENAGDAVVFPACGSASPSGAAACSADGATAQVTISWNIESVHGTWLDAANNEWVGRFPCTGVTIYGPFGSSGAACSGTQAVTVPGNGPYQIYVQGYGYNPNGRFTESSESYPVSGSASCSRPQGTPALSISKQMLPYQFGQACSTPGDIVHPGSSLCYRMNISASGADQTGVQARDHIPGGTTMVWQGGGTDTNSSAQIAGGVDGNGDAWWYQYQTPASGWGGYVDFTARVNDNYFSQFGSGSSICNDARILSDQVGAIYSNSVCSPVGPDNPAWIIASCNESGTAVVEWAPSSGAVSYYPRLWVPSGPCPNPQNGWQMWTDSHTCYINGFRGGTAVTLTGLAPGNYSTWVHAAEPVDWELPPAATSFTCPAPATAAIRGYKVSTENAVVAGQTVSVSGGPSSAANPYAFSVAAGATYTVSVPPLAGYTIGYTLCIDRTDCHNSAPTPGTSAPAAIPAGAGHYADLWWHYTSTAGPNLQAYEEAAPRPAAPAESDSIQIGGWAANYGTGTVPAGSFPNLIQVNDAPNGGGATVRKIVANASGPIAAYAGDPAPFVPNPGPFLGTVGTLPAGSYSYRVCANTDADWNHPVSETNTGDNCNIWIDFTVSGTGGGSPSVSCSPNKSEAEVDESITYTATPSGFSGSRSYQYTWTSTGGSPSSQGPSGQNAFVTRYGESGDYAAHVRVTRGSQSAENDCRPVTVGSGGSCEDLAADISADPTRVASAGDPTDVSWSATGVEGSCTITRNGVQVDTLSNACDSTKTDERRDDRVFEQTKYCISCDGATTEGQAGYDCVTVNVGSEFQNF